MKTLKYGPSIYYFHDKAIFDGLVQSQVTKQDIQGLLLKKGVFLSPSVDKSESAYYLSSYIFDFHDKNKLSDCLLVKQRRENISSVTIKNCQGEDDESTEHILSDEDIKSALEEMKSEISESGSSNARIVKKSDSYVMEVNYKNYDLTKSEMRQVEPKTSVIEVEFTNGELKIRAPANDYMSGIVAGIQNKFNAKAGKDLEKFEIDLSGATNAKQISDFFRALITNIDDYKLFDVTNVKLFHPDEKDEEEEAVTSYIRRAMLHGEGVLSSPELNSMFDRQFYISTIQWESVEVGVQPQKVSFEASLMNPEERTGFTYQVRSINRYSDRTKNIVQKSDKPSSLEKKSLHAKIEKAAQLALASAIK
jgi:hypothetical protein